ncbi:cell division protein FtsK, partial [Prauserella sp. PE36]
MTTTDNTGQPAESSEELARVHYLPTRPEAQTAPVTADAGVVEGELISEEEYRRRTSQKAQAIARYKGYAHDAVVVGRVVKTVATHEHTKTVGKALMRHGSYVLGGGLVLGKRVWEAKTNSRYERMQRMAESRGDWEALKEWEMRSEQARERRHRR